MCLITLLHLGGEALLATWQHQSVEELYQWFGISVNYLIGQFEENADERFCHCALTYAKAISSCQKFRQSCDVLFSVLRVWLPKCETFTIDCQEKIIQALLHACYALRNRYSTTLELYDVAYAVCNINGYSQYRPSMAVNICYNYARFHLGKSCESTPQTIALQGEVWLRRALFHTKMKPQQSSASLELLVGVYCHMLSASTTDGRIRLNIHDETSTLAMDILKRLLPALTSLLKRKSAVLGARLEYALFLLLTSQPVATPSDLDIESAAVLCRKLAQLVSPVHGTVEQLHAQISVFFVEFSFLTCTEKIRFIIFFQQFFSEHPQTIADNWFSRTKAWKRSVKTEPDPAVVRTMVDILIREMMLCGKSSHAKVLQEAFRLWPCKRDWWPGTNE